MAECFAGAHRPVVAIAGATGRIGSALTAKLVDQPVHIVALTRDPNTGRLPPDIDQAAVDFANPATLSRALETADRLFLAQGTSAQQVHNEIAFIDAAVSAGVSHIVKVSAMGPPTRLHPFDWHMEIEAHLATHDIGYTVLRASTFVDVLARAAKPVAAGSWGGAAGHGRVNLVDVRDIADAAYAVLLDEGYLGSQRALHLTGPGSVSMQDVAAELSRLLCREVAYEQRTPAAQREVLIGGGTSEMMADLLLGLDRLFNESVLSETTSTVRELTGREPRTVAAWLLENISAFRAEPASSAA